jgi:hypothetical protein
MKAVEGSILGFAAGENCGGLTCDPLTWMISASCQTEILWFTKDIFQALWDEQKDDDMKQTIMSELKENSFFKNLSEITMY